MCLIVYIFSLFFFASHLHRCCNSPWQTNWTFVHNYLEKWLLKPQESVLFQTKLERTSHVCTDRWYHRLWRLFFRLLFTFTDINVFLDLFSTRSSSDTWSFFQEPFVSHTIYLSKTFLFKHRKRLNAIDKSWPPVEYFPLEYFFNLFCPSLVAVENVWTNQKMQINWRNHTV